MDKRYLIERFKEPSTWRGIILLLTACGVPFAPGQAEQIIAVGMAIAGLLAMILPDKMQ